LLIGILWIVLVLCEMLGVSAGLGYYTSSIPATAWPIPS
jgi:ABC-type nitrate/sulfonate/bicarbonate transport system permease component